MLKFGFSFLCLILGLRAMAADSAATSVMDLSDYCFKELKNFPGPTEAKLLKRACAKVQMLDGCQSVESRPIFHFSREGQVGAGKRVLVFSMIHGDERPAGSVGRYWLERLEDIAPRNSWRVVPILNPDGVKRRTRTNANKIDLNRNFPTKDWDAEAIKAWKITTSSNPRRFPGENPASEPETKCALSHIDDFKPDFIVSIHTPLKVLDFDGPKVAPPAFPYLPWKSLGHFPGSLGRYMWAERQTPVLTLEMREGIPTNYKQFEKLQDLIGTLVKLEIPPKMGIQSSGAPESNSAKN